MRHLQLSPIIKKITYFTAEQKKSLLLEKESIQELKAELSEYSEDVEEMQEIVKTKQADIKLTKGARRYGYIYFLYCLVFRYCSGILPAGAAGTDRAYPIQIRVV